jgi:hypothetical protein
MRWARQYTLLHPQDCDPPHGLDLSPGSRDDLKVTALAEAFATSGFDPCEPALVGYPLNYRVQLLTGTHRHEAARRTGILLPVRLVLRSAVEGTWGTERWETLVRDVPVKDLECAEVEDGGWTPTLEERVSLERGEGE